MHAAMAMQLLRKAESVWGPSARSRGDSQIALARGERERERERSVVELDNKDYSLLDLIFLVAPTQIILYFFHELNQYLTRARSRAKAHRPSNRPA